MKFNLSKEIRLLREEVFQQLPHSRQEKRRLLLEARSLLWNISTEQVYKEKKKKEGDWCLRLQQKRYLHNRGRTTHSPRRNVCALLTHYLENVMMRKMMTTKL